MSVDVLKLLGGIKRGGKGAWQRLTIRIQRPYILTDKGPAELPPCELN